MMNCSMKSVVEDMTEMIALVQRRKHVSSQRELEVSRLLQALHQPQGSSSDPHQHPLNTLHSINEARKLPGYGPVSEADQLRMMSIKVIKMRLACPPHKGSCLLPGAMQHSQLVSLVHSTCNLTQNAGRAEMCRSSSMSLVCKPDVLL